MQQDGGALSYTENSFEFCLHEKKKYLIQQQ